MAATNYTPIQLYYSTTASTAPVAGNLTSGELAINITDGKLYYKDNGGVVQVMATKGTGSIGGATTQIQYNNAGALAGNAAMTFNSGTSTTTLTTLNLTNALGATYGGTAQSAYTQGDILYSSATNTLSKLGIGTTNYILTSTGSVPQWVAPTSITVQTANNLAGGLAGSVPYQSAVDTTTFLAIGAANRIMSSSGTAPQWVTALTGLTGVSSSSITNTSLTSGRVVISSTAGLEADSANLTFNGTTLSTTGLSNTGFSTLVKTLTLGDSNFNGTAVFAPATPAKLYLGTGTVTDVTSAASATNTTGAIASLAITPIAATNASVTYTNASTLYIAGAPSAGTNVTITNPYSLYVAAGNAYFGGGLTFAGALSITDTTDATSTTTGSIKTAGGVGIAKSLWVGLDANIYGITVGRGAGAVATNTAVGASALAANTTGTQNAAFGWTAGQALTTGTYSTAVGSRALQATTTGNSNTAVGTESLFSNTTASNNTAVGYQAGYTSTTGAKNTFVGYQAGYDLTTGIQNTFIGSASAYGAGSAVTTGSKNVILGGYTGSAAPISATGSNYIVLSDGDGNVRAYWNGANPTFPGVLTLSDGTANGVPYLNGSKQITTGSALTFDGTTFIATGAARIKAVSSGDQLRIEPQAANSGVDILVRNSVDNDLKPLNIYGSTQTWYVSGGARAMDLTSTGLGIGASSPAYKLDVTGTINSGASTATGFNMTFRTSGITTGRAQTYLNNTSGDFLTGIEGSTAGQTISGSAAYSAYVGTFTANPLYLVTNATIKATLDSAGNLGLGGGAISGWANSRVIQTDPTFSAISTDTASDGNFSLSWNAYATAADTWKYRNTGIAANRYRIAQGSYQWFTAPSGTADAAITFTQAMTLDVSGNLLVGTTAKVYEGKISVSFDGNGGAGAQGISLIDTNASLNGDYALFVNSSGNIAGRITHNGTTTVAYTTSSDYRLKNITGPITTSGAYIDSLKPVEGTWKADGSTFVGLIAHETQEASRTTVATGTKDGDEMQGMDYSSAEIIANLIAELQSLRARVASLESK